MAKREIHQAQQVFTPTMPARVNFVQRDELLNNRLVYALRTNGTQIVIFGHTGSGKTTLLVNKLHELYERHITTRCYEGMSFDQLLANAFDELDAFYSAEIVQSSKAQVSTSLQADYLSIKSQLGTQLSTEEQAKQQRVVPVQLTPQALATFLGSARCCWVLEDFHKIKDEEKTKLAQVMKMFMDMSVEFNELKIVAVGAVETARQVIQYDQEMKNRVAEIQVPLMDDDEIGAIIENGEALLNFTIEPLVRRSIVSYSSGTASICHHLCLNMCLDRDINSTLAEPIQINDADFRKALELYLENAEDSLKSAFDKALRQIHHRKFDNGRIILQSLMQCPQEGATHAEILFKIKQKTPDYPAGNLTTYLAQLEMEKRGAVVRRDSASGKYSFADPFYRVFAKTFFDAENRRKAQHRNRTLTEELDEASKAVKRALALAEEQSPGGLVEDLR